MLFNNIKDLNLNSNAYFIVNTKLYWGFFKALYTFYKMELLKLFINIKDTLKQFLINI